VLQGAGDFSAGVASALTFGLSDKLIGATGLGKYGSKCSGSFAVGRGAGLAVALVGGSLAALGKGAAVEGAEAVANTIPSRMARVIPAEFAGGARLAAPGATEAWVTAAEDLDGITTAAGLAERLTLVDEAGNIVQGSRAVIEFDAVTEGLASPVLRDAPGFVGGGLTAGGAREFVLPNLSISELSNVVVRILQ
jgi:hypothetical protein